MNYLTSDAEFCYTVKDNSLRRIGLLAGDLILCDSQTEPARFLVVDYGDGGDAHICTQLSNGVLFDNITCRIVPCGVKVCGRVLGFQRSMIQLDETPANEGGCQDEISR